MPKKADASSSSAASAAAAAGPTASPAETEVDVVIIGAGASGLAAARHLSNACPLLSVAVLEAQNRVGGRTLSVSLGRAYCDLGGQWLGSTQERARALAAELGVDTHLQYCAGKKVLDLHGKMQTYSGDIPLGLSVCSLADTQILMWRLDALRKLVPADHAQNRYVIGLPCLLMPSYHVSHTHD